MTKSAIKELENVKKFSNFMVQFFIFLSFLSLIIALVVSSKDLSFKMIILGLVCLSGSFYYFLQYFKYERKLLVIRTDSVLLFLKNLGVPNRNVGQVFLKTNEEMEFLIKGNYDIKKVTIWAENRLEQLLFFLNEKEKSYLKGIQENYYLTDREKESLIKNSAFFIRSSR